MAEAADTGPLNDADEDELEDLIQHYMKQYPNPKPRPENGIMRETYSAYCPARITRYPILQAHVKKLIKADRRQEAFWFLRELKRYEIRPPGTGSHPPKKLLVLCSETRVGSRRVKRGELDRELEREAEALLAADDSDVESAVDVSAEDPDVVSIGDDDGEEYKVAAQDDDDGEWEDWRKFAALEAQEKEKDGDDDDDDDDDVMIIEPSSSTAPGASSSSAPSTSAYAEPDAPSSPSSVDTLSPLNGPSCAPAASREAEVDAPPSPSSLSKASGASASASSAVPGRRSSAPSLPPPFASALDDESDWDQGAGQGNLKDLETDSEGHIDAEDTDESQGGGSSQAESTKFRASERGGGSAASKADGKGKGRTSTVVDLTIVEKDEEEADEEQKEETAVKRRNGSVCESGSEGEGGSGRKRFKREPAEGDGKGSKVKSGEREPTVAVGLRYDRELRQFVSVPVRVNAVAAAADSERKPPASEEHGMKQEQGKGREGVPIQPPMASCIDLTEDDDD